MLCYHWITRCTAVCCALLLSACSLTDNYNAQAHQQLEGLETSYLHFIADAATAPLDTNIIARDDSELRQGFDEALMLAATLNDPLRIENLTLLEDNYFRLHARVIRQNSALTEVQARLFTQQARQAWQLAIEGECLRPGSACHLEK